MGKCRICDAKIENSLDLGLQPFANKYPQNKDEKKNEIKQNMLIEFCSICRSAQIASVIDRSLMFEDYYYLSSVNTELVKHFETFVITNLLESKFVLDIGSNDGILLRPLTQKGIKCLGVDPSVNVGKIANEEGLETLIGFYDANLAKKIIAQYGYPNDIVASSVFTHIEEPKQFIKDLKLLCASDTSVYIEIEYLKNLIDNLQFERFYFDRPHYYSVHAMKYLFGEVGFDLIDVEEITPHGGSLRLKFQLSDPKNVINHSVDRFLHQETMQLSSESFENFSLRVSQEANIFKNKLGELTQKGLKIVGYGCPARVATITNYANVDSSLIQAIAEDSPLKVNRFSPGMHIPIIASEELSEMVFDIFVVFAYEYFESIHERTKMYKKPYYAPIPFKIMEI